MTGPMWQHDVTICLNTWSDMRGMIQFVTLKDCQFCFLYFDMRFNDFGSCLDCFLRIVSQSSGTDLVFKESGLPRPHVGRPAAMDLRPRVFNQIKSEKDCPEERKFRFDNRQFIWSFSSWIKPYINNAIKTGLKLSVRRIVSNVRSIFEKLKKIKSKRSHFNQELRFCKEFWRFQ